LPRTFVLFSKALAESISTSFCEIGYRKKGKFYGKEDCAMTGFIESLVSDDEIQSELKMIADDRNCQEFLATLEAAAPQGAPETEVEFEEFYRSNIRLLRKVVQPYLGLDEYDDLLQEASIGLLKGLQTFNPQKNIKLTTYAFVCARNQVRMYIRKNSAKSRSGHTESLETNIIDDSGDGDGKRLIDYICGDDGSAEKLEDALYRKSAACAALNILANEMDYSSMVVVRETMRGTTQSKIGEMLHVSQSKVSKILSATLKQLKVRMQEQGFASA